MASIVTGTVVVWKIDTTDPHNPRVKYDYAQDVIVYASGEVVDSAITPEIIGRFIDDKPQKDKLDLIKLAGQGLVQVVGIRRTSTVPPPLP